MTVVRVYGTLRGYSWRYFPDEDSIVEETLADICQECCEIMLDNIYNSLLKTSQFLQKYEPEYFAPYTNIFAEWLKEYQHFVDNIELNVKAISAQHNKPSSSFSCCGLYQDKQSKPSLTNQLISHIVNTHMRLDTASAKKIQAIATIKDDDEERVRSLKPKT